MELKKLKKFAKSFKILLVDDDQLIHTIFRKMYEKYFTTIDYADDGIEAMEILKNNKNKYDFVIVDIQMPNMNGIELVKNIRSLDEEIYIVVASAHERTEYLIELINYGINYFMKKPITQDTTKVLVKICANVINKKVLKDYLILLETSQIDLEKHNRELEDALRKVGEVENKNIVLASAIQNKKEFPPEHITHLVKKVDTISAEEFHNAYPTDLESKNTNMENIEELLDRAISKIATLPTTDTFESISSLFGRYAESILLISEFSNIGLAIKSMADTFKSLETIKNATMVEEVLFSISRNIEQWRISIFYEKSAEDIHYLDNSLIGDCMQVEMMIKPKTEEDDDDSGDIDFF